MRKSIVAILVAVAIGITGAPVPAQETSTAADAADYKLNLVLTFDVEDDRGSVPRLITGEGVEGEPGVYFIMSTLEQAGFKGVFFVNVYEHKNYDEDFIPNLLQDIDARGHEVGLHPHESRYLDFYNTSITKYSYDEQLNIIRYGRNIIHRAIHKHPISYRAGAYRVNDDTFRILGRLEFKIDSSLFFKYKKDDTQNNVVKDYYSINLPVKIKRVLEIPIFVAYKKRSHGRIVPKMSKADFNWMNVGQLKAAVQQAKRNHVQVMQVMAHSFSFLRQRGKPGEKYYQEGSKRVYGPNLKTIKRLKDFVEYLKSDDEVRVLTFREYYEEYGDSLNDDAIDFIPVVPEK